jgi:hypothetical protein
VLEMLAQVAIVGKFIYLKNDDSAYLIWDSLEVHSEMRFAIKYIKWFIWQVQTALVELPESDTRKRRN